MLKTQFHKIGATWPLRLCWSKLALTFGQSIEFQNASRQLLSFSPSCSSQQACSQQQSAITGVEFYSTTVIISGLSQLLVCCMVSLPSFTPSQTQPGQNRDCTTFLNASLNDVQSVKCFSMASASPPYGSLTSAVESKIDKKKIMLKRPPSAALPYGSSKPAVSCTSTSVCFFISSSSSFATSYSTCDCMLRQIFVTIFSKFLLEINAPKFLPAAILIKSKLSLLYESMFVFYNQNIKSIINTIPIQFNFIDKKKF